MSEILHRERDFRLGVFVSRTRGKEPPGTLADSKNVIPVDGSLQNIYGYSTTDGLSALPTAFTVPTAGSATTFDISNLRANPFPFSAEVPTAFDGRVYWVTDNQGTPQNHVMFDTYFWGSTTAVSSPNSGFVLLDERKSISGAVCTIGGGGVTLTVDPGTGLSATADYYGSQTSSPKRPPWLLEYSNGGTVEYATIIGYAKSGTISTFTTLENMTTMGWVTAGATFTIRRWFHKGVSDDSGSFGSASSESPKWQDPPGKCFHAGNRVRGCGGASLSTGYQGWISGYINSNFFANSANPVLYQGTYVDMMECDVPSSNVFSGASNPSYVDESGAGSDPLPSTGLAGYRLYHSLEYHGYEEGKLSSSNTPSGTFDSTTKVRFDLRLIFARLNKHATGVNVYMSQVATDGTETQAYFIKRYPITSDSSASWTLTTGTTAGSYDLINNDFKGADWAAKGGTYESRTGHTQDSAGTDAVIWQYVEVVNGRAFFGKFYDYESASVLVDEVRSSTIDSSGSPCYDVVPTDTTFRFTVASGDPGSIKNLRGDAGSLYVFKDSSIHGGFIDPEPSRWQIVPISLQDGLVAVDSLVSLPNGGIGFADTDGYKLLQNNVVRILTGSIEDTYTGYGSKSSIVAWYDEIDRTVNFTTGSVTDKIFWRVYIERPFVYADETLYPVFKIVTANEVQYVCVDRDGVALFGNNNVAFEGFFAWHQSDRTFGGSSIIPYFKTHPYVKGEELWNRYEKIVVVKTKSGSTASTGTLDNKFYVDGTQVLRGGSNPWTSQDKTKTLLFQKIGPGDSTPAGVTAQFEYNTNASGETNGTDLLRFHEVQIWGESFPQRNVSK